MFLTDPEEIGAWTENTDPRPTSNVYEDLVTVIETLAMYPPCADG